ncbi:hypothetical protein AB0323_13340 [Arthrobacter sp. NPDC080031]|uniref:hypothetical protein n=1 Tax=Arthrobacter sp. NPDC080031 TaxID=3155918 RepID=UPI00344B6379
MDFWIPLLGGALGAALINGIVALYKLKRDRQVEHSQWLRDAKQEAYANFFRGADAQFNKVNQWVTGRSPEAAANPDELAVQRAMVKLIGSPEVRRLAREIEAGLINAAFKRTVAFAAAAEMRGNNSGEASALKDGTFADYDAQTKRLREYLIQFVTAARHDLDAGSPEDEGLNENQNEIVDPRSRIGR